MSQITTIRVQKSTVEKLNNEGARGQTLEEIILELIADRKKLQQYEDGEKPQRD